MGNFLKPFGIIATNLFVMAVIALAVPAGDLSAQSAASSLDGVWQANNGYTVTINGSTAVSMQLPSGALWRDAISKGYVKVGDQIFRNLVKTSNSNSQWSGQELVIGFRSYAPNAATGVRWEDRTITMNANGESIRVGNTTYNRNNLQQPAPVAAPSINGVWEATWGHTIGISGNTAVYVDISVQDRWQDAILKGYINVGGQKLRNLARAGELTWTGEDLDLAYDTSTPDVAIGVIWRNCTVTMSEDGKDLIIFTFGKDYAVVPYTRK